MEPASALSLVARAAFTLHAGSCLLARHHPAGPFEALVLVAGTSVPDPLCAIVLSSHP